MCTLRHLEVRKQGDVSIVRFGEQRLVGDLPLAIGEELLAVAAHEDCMNLLVSFDGVDLLSSEMLGKLIILYKRMRQKGGRLKLCGICPNIREVFSVTKFDTILDIKEDEANGVMAFA